MRPLLTIMLGSAFAVWSAASGLADVASGKQIFDAGNCGGCHYTDGPAREKTIDDQLAKKGPELWYAGSKFQQAWLVNWLESPKPIRIMAYNSLTEKNPGDHPSLSSEDAAAVGDFLMSLTSDTVKPGVVKPKKNPRGRLIFIKKMPCSGCHRFPSKKKFKGGASGPSLVGAGDRLNPDWILAYLLQPEVFKPIKMMPVFVDLLSEKQMKSVAAFVASFRQKK